jgi:molecular chaperone DnaK (HSP70)
MFVMVSSPPVALMLVAKRQRRRHVAKKAIGVDLRTINRCVAVMENGKARIIENEEGMRREATQRKIGNAVHWPRPATPSRLGLPRANGRWRKEAPQARRPIALVEQAISDIRTAIGGESSTVIEAAAAGLAQATAAAQASSSAPPRQGANGNEDVVDARFEAVDDNPPG